MKPAWAEKHNAFCNLGVSRGISAAVAEAEEREDNELSREAMWNAQRYGMLCVWACEMK